MSGREIEPVAAFFPSIDRNLMADLDRHLRITPLPEPVAAPAEVAPAARPDIDGIVEAVEQAASSIGEMTSRIRSLETQVAGLTATNARLTEELATRARAQEESEARTRIEIARAAHNEHLAGQHYARAQALEQDLASAMADLARVTDAIANALGYPNAG